MSLDTLADAFYDELCDVYHAEKQLLKALPKMIKKATDEKLVEALTLRRKASVLVRFHELSRVERCDIFRRCSHSRLTVIRRRIVRAIRRHERRLSLSLVLSTK